MGFHTFRHTYSTLLKANGEDVKVAQEFMLYANISNDEHLYRGFDASQAGGCSSKSLKERCRKCCGRGSLRSSVSRFRADSLTC